MYIWHIGDLVRDLQNNQVPRSTIRLYYILSPLLSLLNGLFFGVLLFGHHIVEYSFQSWLKKQHPDIDFYNYWAWALTFLTIFIAFSGIYFCYRANKSGDNKNFWARMACLSFPINFNITIYSLAILGFLGLIGYFFLQHQIAEFKQHIWPSEETINTTIQKIAGDNPLAEVAVKTIKREKGILGTILSSPTALLTAPLIPMRIKGFLKDMRAMILMYYPILSLLPAFLSFLHYFFLRKMIKRVAHKQISHN